MVIAATVLIAALLIIRSEAAAIAIRPGIAVTSFSVIASLSAIAVIALIGVRIAISAICFGFDRDAVIVISGRDSASLQANSARPALNIDAEGVITTACIDC